MAGGDVCSSESFNEDIAVFSKQVRRKEGRKEGKRERNRISIKFRSQGGRRRRPSVRVRPLSHGVVAVVVGGALVSRAQLSVI